MLAITPIAATPDWSEQPGLAEMARLRAVVESENACALPGCSIKYNSFLTVMWRAVQRGFVSQPDAVFTADGLGGGEGGGGEGAPAIAPATHLRWF